MTIFDIILRFLPAFLGGLRVTFQLAGIAWISGLILGPLIGAAAHTWSIAVGWLLRGCAFLLSGVPFLVILYWAHFPMQALLGIVINPFITASVVLSFINVVSVAEIWRGALDDFRDEYRMAAQACGMTRFEAIRYVELPMLMRQVMPTLLAVQIVILQSTLFASLISVNEIFRAALEIDSSIHKPVQIFTALALFFMLLCVPAYAVALWLRRRFTRNTSER
jgi:His/Glu/Gln/Arg/opine family amino acid ABC transporter permease subunit